MLAVRKSSRSLDRGLTISGLASKKIPKSTKSFNKRVPASPNPSPFHNSPLLFSFPSKHRLSLSCLLTPCFSHIIDRESHRTRIRLGLTSCIPCLFSAQRLIHHPITFSAPWPQTFPLTSHPPSTESCPPSTSWTLHPQIPPLKRARIKNPSRSSTS